MELPSDWKLQASLELQQAEAARAVGNEGRARVCARRAAGIIAREFLQQQGVKLSSPSAYDTLRYLLSSPLISSEVREKASHFLLRVETDFTLPIDVDLIAEVNWLAHELLGQSI